MDGEDTLNGFYYVAVGVVQQAVAPMKDFKRESNAKCAHKTAYCPPSPLPWPGCFHSGPNGTHNANKTAI